MPADSYTGAKIRRARKLLRMRQQDLAAKLGVSRSAVDAWENDRSYPKRYDVALEQVLGIRLDETQPEPGEWQRWEQWVLGNPDLPAGVAEAIVRGARAARDEAEAARGGSARTVPGGRHRAAG